MLNFLIKAFCLYALIVYVILAVICVIPAYFQSRKKRVTTLALTHLAQEKIKTAQTSCSDKNTKSRAAAHQTA